MPSSKSLYGVRIFNSFKINGPQRSTVLKQKWPAFIEINTTFILFDMKWQARHGTQTEHGWTFIKSYSQPMRDNDGMIPYQGIGKFLLKTDDFITSSRYLWKDNRITVKTSWITMYSKYPKPLLLITYALFLPINRVNILAWSFSWLLYPMRSSNGDQY